MNSSTRCFRWLSFLLILVSTKFYLQAADKYEPGDPIAAIDGNPVYLGELNLILTERFRRQDLEAIPIEIQRATAMLLVRRHLAMKSLEAQGGDALRSMIRNQIEAFAAEANRRGSSVEEQAKSRMSDEKSFNADLAWRVAWGRYLQSKMTEQNLRRFFDKHSDIYGGSRYDVSQILVQVDQQDQASIQNGIANLNELAEQIRASEDPATAFADAAREHSEAAASAEGGHIGWVENEKDLPIAVLNVVRQTPAGQVSKPIRSPQGLQLVFVHGVEKGNQSFDDLVDQAQLRRDAADALFDNLVAAQSGAKVDWFVPALRPPDEASREPSGESLNQSDRPEKTE